MIGSFIAGVISLMTPLVIGLIFNSIQQSITSDAELNKLLFFISLLLVIEVGFWIFHGIARVLEQKTGFFVHRNFMITKIKRVLELPVKWHKDNHSGDTIDKINRSDESIFSFSQHTTSQIVYAILNIFGSLIILFFIDKLIALFALGFSLITLFILMKVDRKLTKHYKELNKYSNKVSAAIFDYLSNIITVITLRLKKTVSQEIDTRIMDSYETEKKAIVLNEFKWGFASIVIVLMIVLVLSYKAYTDYKTTGIILIGTLYILYGYLSNVGRTFFSFAELYGAVVKHDTRIKGAHTIDDAFNEVDDEVKRNLPIGWKEIESGIFDYLYDYGIEPTLHNVIAEQSRHLSEADVNVTFGRAHILISDTGREGNSFSHINAYKFDPNSPLLGAELFKVTPLSDKSEEIRGWVGGICTSMKRIDANLRD